MVVTRIVPTRIDFQARCFVSFQGRYQHPRSGSMAARAAYFTVPRLHLTRVYSVQGSVIIIRYAEGFLPCSSSSPLLIYPPINRPSIIHLSSIATVDLPWLG